ncbi:hypothetical protein AeMF1_005783, partial [Aphanomyces euteiches]
ATRNGEKLPIMFVLKGKPGGYIDTNELYLYPPEHLYAVQQNAWIDGERWKFYLDNVLRPEIIKPSLIVIDNFDAHTTAKNIAFVEEELSSVLCTLPPNTTSVLQPLDVGVMGPFKAKLRNLWLHETNHPSSAVEKRMACIKRAIQTWEEISPETIRKGYTKT